MKNKRQPLSWTEACDSVARALTGTTRRDMVDHLMGDREPFLALRGAMKRNTFAMASGSLGLQRVVASLDARSRQEGLHLVQAWDFGKHRFTDDSIPVLLLDHCGRLAARKSDDRATMALLLDQYFVTVISLLAVRAWDEGDANANLDRVSALLRTLQGPDGSRHPFIEDAESLLFLAISYYHPEEFAYDRLLAKVESLDGPHQLRVAVACAGMMSAHLRWGLRFMYERDLGRMRSDNVADYPWLAHAVATLAAEYDRLVAADDVSGRRNAIAGSLLLGLASDPLAFTGGVPPVLRGRERDHQLTRGILAARRASLLDDLERMGAEAETFSPLSFTCNFPTNAAVALVTVAIEDGTPYPPLNALFGRGASSDGARLAERLMKYAASDPSRLGAGGAPLAVHDRLGGASALNALRRSLREMAP